MNNTDNSSMASDVTPRSIPKFGESTIIGKGSTVKNSNLAFACEIGARCKIANSSYENYSYIDDDSDVINTY